MEWSESTERCEVSEREAVAGNARVGAEAHEQAVRAAHEARVASRARHRRRAAAPAEHAERPRARELKRRVGAVRRHVEELERVPVARAAVLDGEPVDPAAREHCCS